MFKIIEVLHLLTKDISQMISLCLGSLSVKQSYREVGILKKYLLHFEIHDLKDVQSPCFSTRVQYKAFHIKINLQSLLNHVLKVRVHELRNGLLSKYF